ncbi:MAG: HAD family acid phosphatase [Candidatus Eisenbacteria bacterium]
MIKSYVKVWILCVAVVGQCFVIGCGKDSDRTHELLNAVLWVQTAAEYQAVCEQSFTLARVRLDEGLADPEWTAAVEQEPLKIELEKLPPAVICDVDETVLDNSEFDARLVADGVEYSSDLWNDWVEQAIAPPLTGAQAFIAYARANGVHVFFVTNRKATSKDKTLANLRDAFGADISEDDLLCRGEIDEWTDDKTTRRLHLAGTHRIVLILGDDLNDFIFFGTASPEKRTKLAHEHRGKWGTKWIIFPNPLYGSWEKSLYDYEVTLPHNKKLSRKYGAINFQKQ